jgi:hypothetical protein
MIVLMNVVVYLHGDVPVLLGDWLVMIEEARIVLPFERLHATVHCLGTLIEHHLNRERQTDRERESKGEKKIKKCVSCGSFIHLLVQERCYVDFRHDPRCLWARAHHHCRRGVPHELWKISHESRATGWEG